MENVNNNYLPKDDNEKLFWLNNFIEKLQEYADSLGFSTSDTITIEQDIQKFRSLLRIKIEYHHAQSIYGLRGPVNASAPAAPRSGKKIEAQPEVPGYLFKRLSSTIKEIKEKPGYSQNMGIELGLIRAGSVQQCSPDFTNINSSIHINKKKGFDSNQ
jgi:hypothetical protein